MNATYSTPLRFRSKGSDWYPQACIQPALEMQRSSQTIPRSFCKWSGWYDCHLALQTHIVHTPLEDTTVLVVIIDHSKSGRDPLVSYLRAHSTNTNRWRFSHNCRTVRSSATTRYAITISGRCTIMEEGVEQSIFNFGVYGSVEHIKEWFCHFNKWE